MVELGIEPRTSHSGVQYTTWSNYQVHPLDTADMCKLPHMTINVKNVENHVYNILNLNMQLKLKYF